MIENNIWCKKCNNIMIKIINMELNSLITVNCTCQMMKMIYKEIEVIWKKGIVNIIIKIWNL
jgi:hypothetical protein